MTNLYEVDECTRDHFKDAFAATPKEWSEYPQVLQIYNHITAMAAEANGAKLVDLYTLMASHPSYFDTCSQYPNAAGHAAIAELLEKTVEEAVAFTLKVPAKK